MLGALPDHLIRVGLGGITGESLGHKLLAFGHARPDELRAVVHGVSALECRGPLRDDERGESCRRLITHAQESGRIACQSQLTGPSFRLV